MKSIKLFSIFVLISILLAACQHADATPGSSFFSDEQLTPYSTQTATATATVTPVNIPTATVEPTMTSTPISYTIKKNETLWEIAAKYGLTTDQIKAANPSVNPYLLGPGMTILIPAPSAGGAETATQNAPASTPYPMLVGDPHCSASLTGGWYCFAEITNGQSLMAANITAEFQLTPSDGSDVLTQNALIPLNRIASGEKLPLFAYFPPPVSGSPVVSLTLKTSGAVNQNGTPTPLQAARIRIEDQAVEISANGLSVSVNAQAFLDGTESVSGKIWIAAVAYDEQGLIVGIRRFVSTDVVKAGESVPVSLNIYSIAGKIVKVEFFGEANN